MLNLQSEIYNLQWCGGSGKMFPAHPEALTAAWLTTALHEAGTLEHAQVISVHIGLLGGRKGAMGRIARLHLEYDRPETGAPRSLIAKFASADPDIRVLGNALGLYEREVNFYSRLAAEVELRTPRCHYTSLNPTTGECLLLIEDLNPARNGDRVAACSPALAELALREVAKLHAAWWQHPRLMALDWLRPFDMPALQAAYQRSWHPFVAQMGPQLSDTLRELGERLGASLSEVFERLWAPPWTLVHNDYQLDNFFFATTAAGPTLTVIDWQSVIRGRGMLDVAGLLGANLSVEQRRGHEMQLLRSYYALLLDRGVQDYSFEQCLIDYRASLLDGLARVVIALASNLREEQERAHREVLWPRLSTAVLDLRVGELLP